MFQQIISRLTKERDAAKAHAEFLSNRISDQDHRYRQLQDSLKEYQKKWVALNNYLNDAADSADLCSEYEEAIEGWNSLQTSDKYRLVSRSQDYDVTVVLNVRVTTPNGVTDPVTDSNYIANDSLENLIQYLRAEGHESIRAFDTEVKVEDVF